MLTKGIRPILTTVPAFSARQPQPRFGQNTNGEFGDGWSKGKDGWYTKKERVPVREALSEMPTGLKLTLAGLLVGFTALFGVSAYIGAHGGDSASSDDACATASCDHVTPSSDSTDIPLEVSDE